MTKKEYAGYEYVENGVCAAQGFTANGDVYKRQVQGRIREWTSGISAY